MKTLSQEIKLANGAYTCDPITLEPFTGNEARVEGYSLPHVICSDGKTVVPIAFRYWTREEKDQENERKRAQRERRTNGEITPRVSGKPDAHDLKLDAILNKLKGMNLDKDLLKEVESLRHKPQDPFLAELPEGTLNFKALRNQFKEKMSGIQLIQKIMKLGIQDRFDEESKEFFEMF